MTEQNQIVKCISWIEKKMNFSKTGPKQHKMPTIHNTQSQSNMCMPTYTLQIPIIYSFEKRKIKISRHPHTMYNKTKSKITRCIAWIEQKQYELFQKQRPETNTKCIRHTTLNLKRPTCACLHALQIPIDRTVL